MRIAQLCETEHFPSPASSGIHVGPSSPIVPAPDDRDALRRKMKEEMAALKNSALAKLERRGYEVRGKTPAQIRQILRRHPTKPVSIAPAAAPRH